MVFASSPGCSSVEETGVFVPFNGDTQVEMLPPVAQLFKVDGLKFVNSEGAELSFLTSQWPFLFQQIKSIDENLSVTFALVKKSQTLRPSTTSATAGFQPTYESFGGRPGKLRLKNPSHGLEEVGVPEPSVFKPKTGTTRNPCSCGNKQGDMVRSITSEGGQGSIGEQFVPSKVDKATI